MIHTNKKGSLRDSAGIAIQNNRLLKVILLILVASINVFELVPPALGVPVTLIAIWLIMWLVRGSWSDLGLRRPESIGKVIGVGIAIGIISELFVMFIVLPLIPRLGAEPLDYSIFEEMKGNVGMFVMYLAVAWFSAGLGEEIIYRGFLMGQVAELLGNKWRGWAASLAIVTIVFALSHAYQGTSGMMLVAFSAVLYGAIYILSGKNLWYTIIAHATADTFIFILFFTGQAERFI